MFEKLANIFRIPDLRKRILFTLGMLFVYRLGGHLPTPGIDTAKLEQFLRREARAVRCWGSWICSRAASCAA